MAESKLVVEKIELAKARVASARAAMDNAAVQLDQARLLLRYTEIRSPGRGIVSKKSVETGMVVNAGTPLMAVVDTNDVWIEANFKEGQLQRLSPDAPVQVDVDAFPDWSLTGKVDSLEAGTGSAFSLFPPENATGNWIKVVQRIPVKIILKDYAPSQGGGPILRVGMSIKVTIFHQQHPTIEKIKTYLSWL